MNALSLASVTSRAGISGCPLYRKIACLSVVIASLGAPAMANLRPFHVDSETCVCEAKAATVSGCFYVGSTAISYDVLVSGVTNAEISVARVVQGSSPSCDSGMELFPLDKVGDPTDPAHFRGAFFLSSSDRGGVCPTDADQCFDDGEGLIEIVIGAARCAHEIIKDIIPQQTACVAAPAVSEWGLVTMVGLVMIAGTVVFRRRSLSV